MISEEFMKFLFLSALFISTNSYAKVDYTNCQSQFNTYQMSDDPCEQMLFAGALDNTCKTRKKSISTSSYYPFELLADGTIKPHPTLNYKNVNGVETLSGKEGMNYQTTIKRNSQGEITEVQNTNDYPMITNGMGGGGIYGPAGAPSPSTNDTKHKKMSVYSFKNETTSKVEIRNGKCGATRIDSLRAIGDESRQDVMFDARLCRKVNQFFKKNPEAASCFDKGLITKAENIFNDYYRGNPDIYGDFDEVETKIMGAQPRSIKTKMKSVPMMGYSMGMMGGFNASIHQMLAPMVPTVDGSLEAITYRGADGFGSSPVIQAMQIKSICEMYSSGMSTVPNSLLTDEDFWAESSGDKGPASSAVTK